MRKQLSNWAHSAKNTQLTRCRVLGIVLISSFSLAVSAELRLMEDKALASITARAGLTLEIDWKVSISEIAYQDQGFLTIEDFVWGGADRTGSTGVTGRFENWKMIIDVAGDSESLAYGFSSLDDYYRSVSSPDAEWAFAVENNDEEKIHSDGSLVFHNTSSQLFDGTRYDRGSDSDVAIAGAVEGLPGSRFADTMDDWRNSAPFGISIGAVKLHDSGYEVGSKTPDGTVLMSGFEAEVLTGPLDIIIENNGGGTDSKVLISDYFQISDLKVDFDFVGVALRNVRFHNERGDTTGLNVNKGADGLYGTADDVATESFGYAHMKWFIAAAPKAEDGLQLAGAIKGDVDLPHIELGNNGVSIGQVYLTDMTISSSLTIRGH